MNSLVQLNRLWPHFIYHCESTATIILLVCNKKSKSLFFSCVFSLLLIKIENFQPSYPRLSLSTTPHSKCTCARLNSFILFFSCMAEIAIPLNRKLCAKSVYAFAIYGNAKCNPMQCNKNIQPTLESLNVRYESRIHHGQCNACHDFASIYLSLWFITWPIPLIWAGMHIWAKVWCTRAACEDSLINLTYLQNRVPIKMFLFFMNELYRYLKFDCFRSAVFASIIIIVTLCACSWNRPYCFYDFIRYLTR